MVLPRGHAGEFNSAGLVERDASAERLDIVKIKLTGAAAAAQLTTQVVGHEARIKRQEPRFTQAEIRVADKFAGRTAALATAQRCADQAMAHSSGIRP
jgi:hypothetical protein